MIKETGAFLVDRVVRAKDQLVEIVDMTVGDIHFEKKSEPYPFKYEQILRLMRIYYDSMQSSRDESSFFLWHNLIREILIEPSSDSMLEKLVQTGEIPQEAYKKYGGITSPYTQARLFKPNEQGKTIITVYECPNTGKEWIHRRSYGLNIDGQPIRVKGDYEIYYFGFIGTFNADCGGIISCPNDDVTIIVPYKVGVVLENSGRWNLSVDFEKREKVKEGEVLTATPSTTPESYLHVIGAGGVDLHFVNR